MPDQRIEVCTDTLNKIEQFKQPVNHGINALNEGMRLMQVYRDSKCDELPGFPKLEDLLGHKSKK